MNQLQGSLRFIPLPALTQVLQGLGSTGWLRITQGAWLGEIAVLDGELLAAQLGPEHGRSALEGMLLGLAEAQFVFDDERVEHAGEPVVARDELAHFLAALADERERLLSLTGALEDVPRLVEHPYPGSEAAAHVTIEAAALQLIPSLVYGHTLEQIAQRRGLARTLRDVAVLQSSGLVCMEPAHPPAAVRPLPAAADPQTGVPDERVSVSGPTPGLTDSMSETEEPEEVHEVAAVPSGSRRRGWREAVLAFYVAETPQPAS